MLALVFLIVAWILFVRVGIYLTIGTKNYVKNSARDIRRYQQGRPRKYKDVTNQRRRGTH